MQAQLSFLQERWDGSLASEVHMSRFQQAQAWGMDVSIVFRGHRRGA
jgi:hypothetical protein